jgi:hypothetical protein
MAETILSYLLAEESSNPQRMEKTASLVYPVGQGWRMGALTLPPGTLCSRAWILWLRHTTYFQNMLLKAFGFQVKRLNEKA